MIWNAILSTLTSALILVGTCSSCSADEGNASPAPFESVDSSGPVGEVASAVPGSPEPSESAVSASPSAASRSAASRPQDTDERPVATQGFDQAHALLTEVLAKYVHGDSVDYAALAKDRAKLDRYIAQLRKVKPAELAQWKRAERYAFWINVYNAHVLELVIDHYPVKSIKDIGSLVKRVWHREFIDLKDHHPDGKKGKLSLDDVEHKILRPRFEDARVHAAVNCASESCPPLRAEAFVGSRLDEQLDEQTRLWLANSKLNRYDAKARTLHVSQIFEWFESDFTRGGKGVHEWIARYAPEAQKSWLGAGSAPKIRYLSYSWKLNDAPRK